MHAETTCNRQKPLSIASIKPFKRRPVCEAAQIAERHEARALCGGDYLCIVVGSTVRAADLASFVYAGAIVYDMTRVHACSDHASVRCVALHDSIPVYIIM